MLIFSKLPQSSFRKFHLSLLVRAEFNIYVKGWFAVETLKTVVYVLVVDAFALRKVREFRSVLFLDEG